MIDDERESTVGSNGEGTKQRGHCEPGGKEVRGKTELGEEWISRSRNSSCA